MVSDPRARAEIEFVCGEEARMEARLEEYWGSAPPAGHARVIDLVTPRPAGNGAHVDG